MVHVYKHCFAVKIETKILQTTHLRELLEASERKLFIGVIQVTASESSQPDCIVFFAIVLVSVQFCWHRLGLWQSLQENRFLLSFSYFRWNVRPQLRSISNLSFLITDMHDFVYVLVNFVEEKDEFEEVCKNLQENVEKKLKVVF